LFPQAVDAYASFLRSGVPDRLWQVVREGKERWLERARGLLALNPAEREPAMASLLEEAPRGFEGQTGGED